MQRITGRLAAVVLAVALAGCGYQLRGQFSAPEGLSPLVWQSEVDAEDLYLSMRNTFALYGLRLDTEPADTLLRVHRVESSEIAFEEATVLALEVEWSLVNGYGHTIIDHKETRAETRLAVETSASEDIAREERRAFLRNRVSLLVLDHLEALTPASLKQNPDTP